MRTLRFPICVHLHVLTIVLSIVQAIATLTVGLIISCRSENEERGLKMKQSDHGTTHDCAHREEEGTMIPFWALENLNTQRTFVQL